jgi:hypothetical protein
VKAAAKHVALLRSGTGMQKEKAAGTLMRLAANDDNHVQEAIARAGGIEPLIALVCSGTDMHKEYAAGM